MARPPRQTDRHQQKTVSFRLPDGLVEQLRVLARTNRRTLSGEAQVAFENHLQRNGLWSPEGARRGKRSVKNGNGKEE
jgi:hypothetical protein